MRKGRGKEAKLSYSGHALMENRKWLGRRLQIDIADGYSERRNALEMLDESLPGKTPITVGADKGYDSQDFVKARRERNATPHIAQNITAPEGAPISMRGRPGSPATSSASASANGSKRSSVG